MLFFLVPRPSLHFVPRRLMLFCVLALVAAAVFVRLGVWQIARLHERQARNAIVAAAQRSAPRPVLTLPRDTGEVHYHAATVEGRFDFEHELVLASRTHQGSPGVELVTPVRTAGSDTAVLVNRGWVYSPDGGAVDRARWREADSAHVTGYVELYAPDAGATTSPADARRVRRLSRSEIASKIPYPVASVYLVETGDTAGNAHPVRREIPVLDDGPHLGYAVQWFCFALVALGGAGAVVARERRGAGGATR
jgi:surfeit locus 1 family protein